MTNTVIWTMPEGITREEQWLRRKLSWNQVFVFFPNEKLKHVHSDWINKLMVHLSHFHKYMHLFNDINSVFDGLSMYIVSNVNELCCILHRGYVNGALECFVGLVRPPVAGSRLYFDVSVSRQTYCYRSKFWKARSGNVFKTDYFFTAQYSRTQ